ncbi:MAG: AEC family transporter [Methanomicrobiales archaeon]|nr:AEC family transporter [Methanomicrobiales archaeon]MDI6876618.1 AEC family transporter [Methanomicrobiales archaeon]
MLTEFLVVADRIFALILLITAGYAAYSLKILDLNATRRISSFLLNIAIPALIIASMQVPRSAALLAGAGELLLLTGILYLISSGIAGLAAAALPATRTERGVFQFAIVFGNVGFMGFPVVQALYGGDTLFYAAIFNLVFNVLVFSLGIALLTRGREQGFDPRLLANPGILASVAGLILFLESVQIPPPFIDAIGLLGNVTAPLAMIVVGALLATFPLREMIGDWRVLLASAVRLLAIPLAAAVLLRPLAADPLAFSVLVTLAAMPAAANTVIFAEQYGSDARLASRTVFVSTLASLATIPLVTSVLLA